VSYFISTVFTRSAQLPHQRDAKSSPIARGLVSNGNLPLAEAFSRHTNVNVNHLACKNKAEWFPKIKPADVGSIFKEQESRTQCPGV
jgi:hypothetical protein